MSLNKKIGYSKYSAGSYLDTAMSLSLGATKAFWDSYDGFVNLAKKEKSNVSTWDQVKQHTPFYKARKSLREKLDTEPGMKFLQSNFIGVIPFVAAGLPGAELAHDFIEEHFQTAPEIAKCVTTSIATLIAQMGTGYIAFMANEVRNNKEKYVDKDGKLSPGKVYDGFKNVIKSFLTFDLSYIGLKTIGQSALLYSGQDPWKASATFDLASLPAWYVVSIPLGLKNGVIKTKHVKNREKRK